MAWVLVDLKTMECMMIIIAVLCSSSMGGLGSFLRNFVVCLIVESQDVLSQTPATDTCCLIVDGKPLVSPITSHVLDTARGNPAEGVHIILERKADGSTDVWEPIANGTTNSDGRVPNLLPPAPSVKAGTYKYASLQEALIKWGLKLPACTELTKEAEVCNECTDARLKQDVCHL